MVGPSRRTVAVVGGGLVLVAGSAGIGPGSVRFLSLFHRIYAVGLALFTGGLVVFASSAFITNVLQNGGSGGETEMTVTPAMAAADVSVTLLAQRLMPAQHMLQSAVVLSAAPLEPGLYDLSTSRPITTCSGSVCSLRPEFRSKAVTVTVASTDPTNPYLLVRHFQLSQVLLPGPGRQTLAFEAAVPIDGATELYPNDMYYLNATLKLSMPGVGAVRPGGTRRRLTNTYIVDGGDMAKTFDVRMQAGAQGEISINVARKGPEQRFIESVALVPIVFALIFLHVLFLHPRLRKLGLEHFLMPIIAAILAILPLRLVLVPNDIEGLTRVDVVLGLGLVTTVAVAVAKYAWEIWSVDDTHRQSLA